MLLRTKLFFTSSSIVLLLWAGAWWPIQHMISANFNRVANDNFTATRQSLHTLQAEQINRMRQVGTMVMNIPELRALIAEHNFELSADNLASLQDRLDSLATVIDSKFICVLDSRGQLIAQNSQSPWQTNANLKTYISDSKQAMPLIRNLFTRGSKQQYSLWVFKGQLYQVVGLPLLFSSDQGDGGLPDGALIMASPITTEMANSLGESHNCQITFLSTGTVLASSLNNKHQGEMLHLYDRFKMPLSVPFTAPMGDVNFASYLEPIEDPPSHTRIGATLIQSSQADAAAMQRKVCLSLLAIMSTGLFFAGFISFFVSGAITKPVRQLVTAVRRVAAGDMESSIQANRHDEIGQLATAFNDMVIQLRHRQELQRLVDESQAATKAKSQFLANMSHEIRTPLNGVIGIANLLLSTPLNDKQRHYAKLVRSSTEVLTTLINDILDFSKIEAGKMELEQAEFDLHTVVEDVVELLSQKAFVKGVEMACHLTRDVPTHLIGDANRLRQILMNLIGNAVKFTDTGEIIVQVTVKENSADAMRLRFAVQDTGPGIPANRLERLFKSFSQVDASTTRKYGGTGLGLAISKQLAEAMGGRVGVESEEGKGSIFWFTANLKPAGATAAVTASCAGSTVIVVHPSPRIGQIMCEQLQASGFDATSTTTAEHATELMKSRAIAVMLIDAKFAPTPVLRYSEEPDRASTHPALRSTSEPASLSSTNPLRLLMTLPQEDVPTDRLSEMGYACSIVKPVRPKLLVQAISALLSPQASAVMIAPKETAIVKPTGGRILLAEDNLINQIVASDLLTNAGYAIDVVGDGQSAVEALRRSKYDLVLMDCQMPVMDGLDATRAIRQAGSCIPIIALTANASNVDRSRCTEAGMDGYCPKPFRPGELLDLVAKFIADSNRCQNSLIAGGGSPGLCAPDAADRGFRSRLSKNLSSESISSKTLQPVSHQADPLHLQTLLDSCTQNPALAMKILEKFQKQVHDTAAQLQAALETQNAAELARLSHGLKGTAGIIGAEPLRLKLTEMESLGQASDLENADKKLVELRLEIDRCAACIPQLIAQLASSPQPAGGA